MPTIFYDLETSESIPVGQILNYSFIEVGENFEIRSECSGTVSLTRLQLPSPEAILANRIDVMELQSRAMHSERDALLRIWDYIADLVRESEEPVRLVGYNSSKFDLPFLRTSFIRNGLNPYFEGKVLYGDLLLLSRKLSVTREDFPRGPSRKGPPTILSLSLETLCRAFNLLEGEQSHESRADVVLTIALAEIYKKQFGAEVREFLSYEAPPTAKKGDVVFGLRPQYELASKEIAVASPHVLLDSDHRSALWLDLGRYLSAPERSSISWMTKATSAFFIGSTQTLSPDQERARTKALEQFKEISVKNFFPKSNCDIEMDIYRLDFQAIEALRQAIWEKNPKKLRDLKSSDLSSLYDRHRMTYYPWGGGHDEKVGEMLKEYALYRYGGRMPLTKGDSLEPYEEGVASLHYHETLTERIERVEGYLTGAEGRDRVLLQALLDLYRASDIVRVGGDALKRIVRIKRSSVKEFQSASL